MRQRLSGRSYDPGFGQRRSPAQPQESPVERRPLPGMRGVRPHLQPQRTQPAVTAGAGDHPVEFGAPGGDDGHRAR